MILNSKQKQNKMIKTIFKNIFGTLICEHEYIFYRTCNVYFSDTSELPIKSTDIFICKHCGKTKRIKM